MRKINKSDVIIHTHMGKSAGTLFFKLFTEKYGKASCIQLNGYSYSFRDLITSCMNKSLKCLSGHFGYGYHKAFNIEKPYYFCVIRNPINRITSEYHFIKTLIRHPKHDIVKNMTLEEYIKSDIRIINHQYKIMTEYDDFNITIRDIVDRLTNDYGLFLLHEKLESSSSKIKEILNITYSKERKENPTQQYVKDSTYDDLIMEHDSLDYMLYQQLDKIYFKYINEC